LAHSDFIEPPNFAGEIRRSELRLELAQGLRKRRARQVLILPVVVCWNNRISKRHLIHGRWRRLGWRDWGSRGS